MAFKKNNEGGLSEDIFNMRKEFRDFLEKLQEFDKTLDDLQKYFYKIEKKLK